MTPAEVRVGIVSWRTAEVLDRCLGALPAALDGLRAEVVVVDNASGDRTGEVVGAHPGTELVETSHNVGYSAGMNLALAGTSAQWLVALNPDTAPPPGSLRRLVEVLEAADDVGLVGPRLTRPDGTLQHSAHRFPSLGHAAFVDLLPRALQRGEAGRRRWIEGVAPHDVDADVDWLEGAVHVVRRAAVEPDGAQVYDERWFMYVSDLDLCHRLDRRGWRRRLVASVEVPHVGNVAGEQAYGRGRAREHTEEAYAWFARTHGALAVRVWAAEHLVGCLVRGIVANLTSRLGQRHRPDREAARALLALVPVHARVLVAGPALPRVERQSAGDRASP